MPIDFGVEALSVGYFFRLISKHAATCPAAPGGWASADPTHLAILHLHTVPNNNKLQSQSQVGQVQAEDCEAGRVDSFSSIHRDMHGLDRSSRDLSLH